MPLKIMLPTKEIVKRLRLEPNGEVQTFFTNTCYTHMDKYVPFDEGNLSSIVTITPNSITYEMPYASYQYYGVRQDGSHPINENNRNRDFHPLATSYWDKKMWTVEKEQIIRETQKYVGGK